MKKGIEISFQHDIIETIQDSEQEGGENTRNTRYSKLRGRIVECYGTVRAFARAYGVTEVAMGRKLSRIGTWSQADILKACDMLSIPVPEIPAYFFARDVQNVEQGA